MGVSKVVKNQIAVQNTRVGTPLYLAPELVKQKNYDFKIDIWAMGCVLFELAALAPPFYGENIISLGFNIVNKNPKKIPGIYSNSLKKFILTLLDKNPAKRPSAKEIESILKTKHNFKQPEEKVSLFDSPKPKYSVKGEITSAKKANKQKSKLKKYSSQEGIINEGEVLRISKLASNKRSGSRFLKKISKREFSIEKKSIDEQNLELKVSNLREVASKKAMKIASSSQDNMIENNGTKEFFSENGVTKLRQSQGKSKNEAEEGSEVNIKAFITQEQSSDQKSQKKLIEKKLQQEKSLNRSKEFQNRSKHTNRTSPIKVQRLKPKTNQNSQKKNFPSKISQTGKKRLQDLSTDEEKTTVVRKRPHSSYSNRQNWNDSMKINILPQTKRKKFFKYQKGDNKKLKNPFFMKNDPNKNQKSSKTRNQKSRDFTKENISIKGNFIKESDNRIDIQQVQSAGLLKHNEEKNQQNNNFVQRHGKIGELVISHPFLRPFKPDLSIDEGSTPKNPSMRKVSRPQTAQQLRRPKTAITTSQMNSTKETLNKPTRMRRNYRIKTAIEKRNSGMPKLFVPLAEDIKFRPIKLTIEDLL